MKIKKFNCLVLCIAILLCVTACKSDSGSASNVDNTNSIAQVDSALAMLYGFSYIKDVEYCCAKNLPDSDAIYSINGIITDVGTDICDSSTEILCDNDDIKIEGKIITIPQSYIKKNKTLDLTVYHSGVELYHDFTIELDSEWDLVFEDQFEGDTLNTDIWGETWNTDLTLERRATFNYGYTKDMIFLDGEGNLVSRIYSTGDFTEDNLPIYKSSLISTKECYESTYGYYEIRMIPHLNTGMWSAFWLLAGDMCDLDAVDDGSAVNGCEIDVIESLYFNKVPSHAIHWDGYYNDQTKSLDSTSRLSPIPEVFDGNYHTFAVSWSKNGYVFLVDGKVTLTAKGVDVCNQPAYMLISSHLSAEAGDITLKPGEYSDTIIDYVRIYQSEQDK